jgi:hypothetical protein
VVCVVVGMVGMMGMMWDVGCEEWVWGVDWNAIKTLLQEARVLIMCTV